MILGAAVLVLLALGLFVGGIVTGVTALYWACVALSLVAAVLLVLARRRLGLPVTPRSEPDDEDDGVPHQDVVVPGRGPEPPSGTTGVRDGTAAPLPAEPMVEEDDDEPPAEEVEVTDLLLVMDLHDEVVVVDEHPRYHLADCSWLRGRTTITLPLDEARTDGFTPCGVCAPDRHLATAERERRARKGTS